MGKRRRSGSLARFLTTLLVTVLVGGAVSPSLAWAAGAAAPESQAASAEAAKTPVVLVHGLTADGPEVWGSRTADGKGLYARLLRAGYVPGRTLFTYDYPEATESDYASLAPLGLDPVVRQALSSGWPDSIDLVTFGTGALIARYWIATCQGGPAPVRNLVMLAPPNHGHFQCDLIKVLYHTDRLVRGTAGGTGAGSGGGAGGRAGGSGTGGGAGGNGAGGAGATGGSAGPRLPDPPAFTSEDEFVGSRSKDYERLAGAYILEARLLDDIVGPDEPPRFDVWVTENFPDEVKDHIFGAQVLPAGGSGEGLTLAYYEMLSLRVGRQLYLAHSITVGKLPPFPPLEKLLSAEWKAVLIDYLKALAFDWGVDGAKALWAREKAGLGVSLAELLTSLEKGSVMVSRLVPERLAFPCPGGTPCGAEEARNSVVCNAFLRDWQAAEASKRAGTCRYVTVAGDAPGPLGLAAPGVGRNDMVVEAASAVTSPEHPDVFRLEEGLLAYHGLLAGRGRVIETVLGTLDGTAEPSVVTGSGLASLWRPAYGVIAAGADAGTPAKSVSLAVDLKVADPAGAGLSGLAAEAWVARTRPQAAGQPPSVVSEVELTPLEGWFSPDGGGPWGGADGGLPGPEGVSGGLLGGKFTVAAPQDGTTLLLGVRLAPDPLFGPAYLTMGRHLGEQTTVPFSYTVRVVENPPPGDDRPKPDPSPGGGSVSVGGGEEYLWEEAPGTAPPPARSGETIVSDQAEIVPTEKPPPLISVILVTKLTTDKREHRIYHARWEWDFGDGCTMTDTDPANIRPSVSHTYETPGTYTVTATSYANDGRLLRQLQWTVDVPPPENPEDPVAATFTFEAETIEEPTVRLTIVGPVKWVTGKPARFEIKAQVSWPPWTTRQVIQAYPGWEFDVVWEKPGKFLVEGAITVRQTYTFPEKSITVYNTYVTVVETEVFIPGITQ